MRSIKSLVLAPVALLALTGVAQADWQPLANPPSFYPETMLLLTDGTVMAHTYDPNTGGGGSDWWRLTPDINGSYQNGTWSQIASMPAGYAPLYFASAVLPDGRVLVEGGEYNGLDPIETNQGAIYDPVTDTWTPVAPPAGWSSIGDATSVVLADGTFMLANALTSEQALFDARTLTWTPTGAGKADPNSEEGWTLLPNDKVLTIDVIAQNNASELYDPHTRSWSSAGDTVVPLWDDGYEIGPAILRPDGSVFAVGASGHTAIYRPAKGDDDGDCDDHGEHGHAGGWSAGPDFPALPDVGQLDSADGPAALLPSGNVLVVVSPGDYNAPAHYFEFDGKKIVQVADPPDAPFDSTYYTRLLVLPTGEVLYSDSSSDMELYSSSGTYQKRWAPVIEDAPEHVRPGKTYELSGTQLNGLSQAVAYGDDVQAATNYPLVRIVNKATKHVFYARTHHHSSMGVATGHRLVSTRFDVPAGIERGESLLYVVANGIPSEPVRLDVR